MWLGPRVNNMDPETVKEVLSKNFNYKIPWTNPLDLQAMMVTNGPNTEKSSTQLSIYQV